MEERVYVKVPSPTDTCFAEEIEGKLKQKVNETRAFTTIHQGKKSSLNSGGGGVMVEKRG